MPAAPCVDEGEVWSAWAANSPSKEDVKSRGAASPTSPLSYSAEDRSSPGPVATLGKRQRHGKREDEGRKLTRSSEEATTVSTAADDSDEDDLQLGRLSKEAEVFALQAIHTALLEKLSGIGPTLADVTRENRLYRKVLEDMGRAREDIKRTVEVELKGVLSTKQQLKVTEQEATVIAAAALGKNLNSPVDAMHDILKLFRCCPNTSRSVATESLSAHSNATSSQAWTCHAS